MLPKGRCPLPDAEFRKRRDSALRFVLLARPDIASNDCTVSNWLVATQLYQWEIREMIASQPGQSLVP